MFKSMEVDVDGGLGIEQIYDNIVNPFSKSVDKFCCICVSVNQQKKILCSKIYSRSANHNDLRNATRKSYTYKNILMTVMRLQ